MSRLDRPNLVHANPAVLKSQMMLGLECFLLLGLYKKHGEKGKKTTHCLLRSVLGQILMMIKYDSIIYYYMTIHGL